MATLVTRRQVESTLATLRVNLEHDPTDRENPRSSAAAKVRMIARAEGQLVEILKRHDERKATT